MSRSHYSNGLPKIWPILTEQDTREHTYRSLSGWLALVVCNGTLSGYNSATRTILIIIQEDETLFHAVPFANGWSMIGTSLIEVWNEAGEKLGYTEWASPEEGDGRP